MLVAVGSVGMSRSLFVREPGLAGADPTCIGVCAAGPSWAGRAISDGQGGLVILGLAAPIASNCLLNMTRRGHTDPQTGADTETAGSTPLPGRVRPRGVLRPRRRVHEQSRRPQPPPRSHALRVAE